MDLVFSAQGDKFRNNHIKYLASMEYGIPDPSIWSTAFEQTAAITTSPWATFQQPFNPPVVAKFVAIYSTATKQSTNLLRQVAGFATKDNPGILGIKELRIYGMMGEQGPPGLTGGTSWSIYTTEPKVHHSASHAEHQRGYPIASQGWIAWHQCCRIHPGMS